MALPLLVKTRLIWLLALALPSLALAADQEQPAATEILKAVRLNQVSQKQLLRGNLRTGPTNLPFGLILNGTTVRYEFPGPPPETISLTLGEKDARLNEVTKEGTERISGKKFADNVQGSDISYEDLSLRFLYWQTASVEKESSMMMRKCWVVQVQPPATTDSQYSRVLLWVDKEAGALLQAEAYGKDGKFARRFRVVSGQKIEGRWYLKQMRIEAPAGAKKDKTPTYLEVQSMER